MRRFCLAVCAAFLFSADLEAQPPGGGRGVIPMSPPVDPVAHDRGQEIWAKQCINCHGTQARGVDDAGPNLIRSPIVNRDRTSFTPGSVLGPFLRSGHPAKSSNFTDDEIVGLAHFLRRRINDTMRGSPVFVPGDVLTGDAKAGEAFFRGDGGCASCHNARSRSLAGIRSRISSTVDLQQRMLFPMPAGGRGRGAPPSAQGAPNPTETTVTISPPEGPPLSGALVEQDSFFVRVRDADGVVHTVRRRPGMKIEITNPFQAHIDLLDRLTDRNIHDLVAYLETLK